MTPPIFQQSPINDDDSDAQADAQASQARQQGTNLVRSHLSNHLDQNRGRSSEYVTWIATLHPENAEVTIDQRFLIPGNPWWTVYEEGSKLHQELPTATAVHFVEGTSSGEGGDEETRSSHPPMPHFCLRCSPIDLFVGGLFSFHALLVVLILETLASVLYLLSAVFYHMAACLNPPNVVTGILYGFLMILYWSFALPDSILLLCSVIVTEFLAALSWFVCLLFGGVLQANYWHQYIRRICHVARHYCRARCCSKPPRHLFLCCSNNSARQETKNQANAGELAVSVVVVDEENVMVEYHF
jgi:hypothetical protein